MTANLTEVRWNLRVVLICITFVTKDIEHCFTYNLKCDVMMPPALFFLFRITLAVWGLLCFHMNFKIYLFISVRNDFGILMVIALNL
jgi:hypothetical protein